MIDAKPQELTQTPDGLSCQTGSTARATGRHRLITVDSPVIFPLRSINSIVPGPAEVRADGSKSLEHKAASYTAPQTHTPTDPSHFSFSTSAAWAAAASICGRVRVGGLLCSNAFLKKWKVHKGPVKWPCTNKQTEKPSRAARRCSHNEDCAGCCLATHKSCQNTRRKRNIYTRYRFCFGTSKSNYKVFQMAQNKNP